MYEQYKTKASCDQTTRSALNKVSLNDENNSVADFQVQIQNSFKVGRYSIILNSGRIHAKLMLTINKYSKVKHLMPVQTSPYLMI